jgi:26S proteasome regulatory subunit N5
MIRLALEDDAYLEACSAYQEVWDTAEIKADEDKARDVREQLLRFICLRLSAGPRFRRDKAAFRGQCYHSELTFAQVQENIFTFVVLAAHNNEQSDMLHKLYADTSLTKAPLHR